MSSYVMGWRKIWKITEVDMSTEPVTPSLEHIDVVGEGMEEDTEEVEAPSVGMCFFNTDEIFELYKKHAKGNGFGAIKLSMVKNHEGQYQFITFGCHRARKSKTKSRAGEMERPTIKTNCKARVCESLQEDGKWRINKVELQHNHVLEPRNSLYLRQHRLVSSLMQTRVQTNAVAGIRTSKTFRALALEYGGFESIGCLERDIQNYLDSLRRAQIRKGDVEAVLAMFKRMQQRDKDFFYEILVDEVGRLQNMVWVDGRSQEAYREFGDVILFDTTYLVNKYQMPFAPFIRVNHHG